MSIWDVHHHWVNERDYLPRLMRRMDSLGIERLGLIAMGDFCPDLFLTEPRVGSVDNADLAKAQEEHPDRIWGYGFLRLGRCSAADVDRIADMGLRGLKFHAPLKPYSEPEYFEIYHRAQELKLPCLFHTGIFYPPTPMPGEGIRSENYRPIHLEPIAHEFPNLRMIAAHLGVCWNEEAATVARMCPNVYVDISGRLGRLGGWRGNKSIDWFRYIFYWPDAHKKVLFGSDVHADELPETLDEQNRIFHGIWGQAECEHVFRLNAERLFGKDTAR